MSEMTRDQAIASKAELERDVEWRNRYLAGGSVERSQMDTINRVLADAGSAATLSPQATAGARHAELMKDKDFATRYFNGDVQARREIAGLIRTLAAEE
jgi:hypothetical protein